MCEQARAGIWTPSTGDLLSKAPLWRQRHGVLVLLYRRDWRHSTFMRSLPEGCNPSPCMSKPHKISPKNNWRKSSCSVGELHWKPRRLFALPAGLSCRVHMAKPRQNTSRGPPSYNCNWSSSSLANLQLCNYNSHFVHMRIHFKLRSRAQIA